MIAATLMLSSVTPCTPVIGTFLCRSAPDTSVIGGAPLIGGRRRGRLVGARVPARDCEQPQHDARGHEFVNASFPPWVRARPIALPVRDP